MVINNSVIKLFSVLSTGLLAGQVCQALPTQQELPTANTLGTRGDSPSGVFGDRGQPDKVDLVSANQLIELSKSPARDDFSNYTTILLGFLVNDVTTVQKWFPESQEEHDRFQADLVAADPSYKPGEGDTFVKVHQSDDAGNTTPALVHQHWVKDSFLNDLERKRVTIGEDFKVPSFEHIGNTFEQQDLTAKGQAGKASRESGKFWWPWALLEGAHAQKVSDFEAIVHALSGYTLTSPQVKKKADKYWHDHISEPRDTPRWLVMKERWWAIVGVDDDGEHKGRKKGRVTLARVDNQGYHEESHKYLDIEKDIRSIHELEQ